MPNAYCWLDEHRPLIGREVMAAVFRQAKVKTLSEEKSGRVVKLWIKAAN
jgi:hypothetical protein